MRPAVHPRPSGARASRDLRHRIWGCAHKFEMKTNRSQVTVKFCLDIGMDELATSFEVIGDSHSPYLRVDGAEGLSERVLSLSRVHFKTSAGESP